MKNKKKVCKECGQVITGEFVEYNGEYICQDCFDESYFYCDDCGKIEHRDNGYWIKDEEKLVCDNCIYNYKKCDDCGDYFKNYCYINNYGYVCEDCFDRGQFGYCSGCNDNFHYDDLHYSERGDCYYCDDCYEEDDDDLLYDYHDFSDWELFKGKNEDFDTVPYYIGKEIELEPKSYDCISEVLEVMNNHINAVGMHDGSLNDGGIEVVTHPESWEYLQEHKQNYKDFFDEVERLGYGDDGNTGLHFHVTRPNDNVVARVIVLLESFKEEIKKLSRRNGNFSWSKFMTDTEYSNEEKV
ncbi:MAG: hypothetical protein IJ568_06420, partial [Bacilli bacterium]|nr:hypothetical protein [Bacilli bacterium]